MSAGTVFAASTAPRSEPRICVRCLTPIDRGQLFRVGDPPRHAFCDPPARLNVQAIAQAARTR